MADVPTPGQTFSAPEFQAILREWHGGLQGEPRPVPPPSGMSEVEKAIYAENPTYRYYFADGSYVEARAAGNGMDYTLEAYKPSSQAAAASKQESSTKPTGTRYGINPDTGQQSKITIFSDGHVRYDDVAPSSAAAKPDHGTVTVGDSIYQYNPDTNRYDIYVGPSKDTSEQPITEYQKAQIELQRQAAERADAAAARAERTANRPQIVSSDTKSPYITTMDVEGNLASQPNPSYDAALAQFDRVKERLALQVQLEQLDATEAKRRMDEWFQMNVELPFKQSAEARARAQEIRQAQEAARREREFNANYGLQRATAGLQAGQAAARNELEMLPYMTGPDFGEQFAAGVNSLARGSSEGINFTGSAFEFKKPNLQKIAEKATANALKQISPAAAALASGPTTDYATADYGGINTTPATPPPSGRAIDVEGIMQSLYGGGGGGGGGEPAPSNDGQQFTPEELAAMGIG